jgi:hypothetical protein
MAHNRDIFTLLLLLNDSVSSSDYTAVQSAANDGLNPTWMTIFPTLLTSIWRLSSSDILIGSTIYHSYVLD